MSETTVLGTIEEMAARLEAAGLSLADGFGQGALTAFDEAAWLVMWRLGLPLDDLDGVANRPVTTAERSQLATLFEARISGRKPAAYLTREAWLMGVPFYVDERVIIPRSFIAELLEEERVLLVQGSGFNWPHPDHFRLVFLPHEDDLRDAIGRVARFLENYRKRHGT